MTNTYVDFDGLVNVSEGIIKNAKRDFIKGGKVLYKFFKRIPTQEELLKSNKKALINYNSVRWMYDAWNFVKKDPYEMFESVSEKEIINSWTNDTIIEYYKELYITGATLLMVNGHTKPIYKISDKIAKKDINDSSIFNEFISARNYINTLPNGDSYFEDWDSIAYGRSKRPLTFLQKRKDKEEKVAKIKELNDAGFTQQAIAKYMGISQATVCHHILES